MFQYIHGYLLLSLPFSRDYNNLYAWDDLELVAREPHVRIGNKLEHLNNGFGAVSGAVELYKNLKG